MPKGYYYVRGASRYRGYNKKKKRPGGASRYYAVRAGHATGIFETREQYEKATSGYSNYEARSFGTLREAREYMRRGAPPYTRTECRASRPTRKGAADAWTDGSCRLEDGQCGCGAIILYDKREIRIMCNVEDIYKKGSATAEIYAAMIAMMYCAMHDIRKLYLHYDCAAVEGWLLKGGGDFGDAYRDFISKLKYAVDVEFVKVKAHAGDGMNERADKLARKASRTL